MTWKIFNISEKYFSPFKKKFRISVIPKKKLQQKRKIFRKESKSVLIFSFLKQSPSMFKQIIPIVHFLIILKILYFIFIIRKTLNSKFSQLYLYNLKSSGNFLSLLKECDDDEGCQLISDFSKKIWKNFKIKELR